MNDDSLYQILRHLDEPTRYIGLTLDDCIIGGMTIVLVMFSSSKILFVLVGIGIRAWVRRLKKGNPPNYLFLLMYWHLPHACTRLFLKNLPKSHQRYWISQEDVT